MARTEGNNPHKLDRRTFLIRMLALVGAAIGYRSADAIFSQMRQAEKLSAEAAAIAKERADRVKIDDDLTKDNRIEMCVRYIYERYGVDIYLGRPRDTTEIDGYISPEPEIYEALWLLREEMGLYPPDFFRRNKITGIRLLTHLTLHNQEVGGVASGGSGIIAANSYCAIAYPDFFRTVLHHEAYHRVDYIKPDYWEKDAAWTARQQDNCLIYQDASAPNAQLPNCPEGRYFIQGGGDTAAQERAYIAAMLMNPDAHAACLYRISQTTNVKDLQILMAKYQEILHDFYTASGGLMGDQFWQDLLDGKVNEIYWDLRTP
jgi:hypothetical protein